MAVENQLLPLWKQAFGDHEGFWELFLETGYCPDRCLYLTREDTLAAALCWFDTEAEGRKWAYIYAVVTRPEFRGQGLCRKLFAQAEELWAKKGYAGALLVPAEESLRTMYRKMGYETCTCLSAFSCGPGDASVPVAPVCPEEYARLRRKYLPPGGVIQEGENLRFLAAQGELLAGEDFLLAAWQEEGKLQGMELLGNREAAPGIVAALGCTEGHFRTPGGETPWAMGKKFCPEAVFPSYFGLAFD